MKASPGDVVRIYVDLVNEVAAGDAIVTQTGRTYLVTHCRRQQRGAHVGRQHLLCVVADGSPPASVRVHLIRWYRRDKKGTPQIGPATPRPVRGARST